MIFEVWKSHLVQAESTVALGYRHLREQTQRVERLESLGLDSGAARELLRTFEQLQDIHVEHRDRLLVELGFQ